ncbi:MAG: hypothetical protein IJA67_12550 [Oscillospiraceae bacterium]|nr:hypothetical protein [Oscillospiraceae bacterium]
MLFAMFRPAVLVLLMFGLIVGGITFNALNGLSIHVPKGAICGFIGKNASGANERQDYSRIPGNKTDSIDHILTDMKIRAAY